MVLLPFWNVEFKSLRVTWKTKSLHHPKKGNTNPTLLHHFFKTWMRLKGCLFLSKRNFHDECFSTFTNLVSVQNKIWGEVCLANKWPSYYSDFVMHQFYLNIGKDTDNPPNINGSCQSLLVGWEIVNVPGDQQGQFAGCDDTDCVWGQSNTNRHQKQEKSLKSVDSLLPLPSAFFMPRSRLQVESTSNAKAVHCLTPQRQTAHRRGHQHTLKHTAVYTSSRGGTYPWRPSMTFPQLSFSTRRATLPSQHCAACHPDPLSAHCQWIGKDAR